MEQNPQPGTRCALCGLAFTPDWPRGEYRATLRLSERMTQARTADVTVFLHEHCFETCNGKLKVSASLDNVRKRSK